MTADELAQAVQEGGNFLGVFLCSGALATLRERGSAGEVNVLLGRGVATYAPAFRGFAEISHDGRDVEPAIERLEVLTRLGVDVGVPGELADIRAAVRELLGAVGFELPSAPPGESDVCPLHGRACPAHGAKPPAKKPRRRATASAKRSAPTRAPARRKPPAKRASKAKRRR
jgi:hypothetical protein